MWRCLHCFVRYAVSKNQFVCNSLIVRSNMEKKVVCFTRNEKILLAQLVKDNDIIENKRTDASTVQQKNKAWENISTIYNSQPEVETARQPQQLRKLWNNLKQRKRKETTLRQHERLLTGGGSPEYVPLDPVLELVESAAPHMDVTVDCPWDSTAAFETREASETLEPMLPQNVDTPTYHGNRNHTRLRLTSESINSDDSGTVPQSKVIAMRNHTRLRLTSESINSDDSGTVPQSQVIAVRNHKRSCSSSESQSGSSDFPARQRDAVEAIASEKDARCAKIREGREQQLQLHEIRVIIAEEELKKVKAERMKAEAEAELAILKLKHYKNSIVE